MAIRKNVLSLNAADRARLVAGYKKMKLAGTYDGFVRRHAAAAGWKSFAGAEMNSAHRGPAFLPWHRQFLITFERALQNAIGDTTFGLPYYDWTDGLGAASGVWGTDLMGGDGKPVSTGPFTPVEWPTVDARGLPARPNGLIRQFDGYREGLPTRADVHRVMYRRVYDVAPWSDRSLTGMRNALEGFFPPGLHNRVHQWIGGPHGQMSKIPIAPNDPVFFLHHCNVDRVWSEWQLVNPSVAYAPQSDGPPGHAYGDAMSPWNTSTRTVRPSDMWSVSSYSYADYYQIGTLKIQIKTGSDDFSGTDDEVSFVIRSSGSGPLWSVVLDPSHCDHSDPFERGQTDTFTYRNVSNLDPSTKVPLTPAALDVFSLGKAPDGSWLGRGDWLVAGIKITADDIVLYDRQDLNKELNNDNQLLNDGNGNKLTPQI